MIGVPIVHHGNQVFSKLSLGYVVLKQCGKIWRWGYDSFNGATVVLAQTKHTQIPFWFDDFRRM